MNPYEMHLDKNAANFQALTPLSFCRRAAWVYPDRVALIHGDVRRTWAEVWARSVKLASALRLAIALLVWSLG